MERHGVLPETYGIYDSPVTISESSLTDGSSGLLSMPNFNGSVIQSLNQKNVFNMALDNAQISEGFTCEYCMQPFNTEESLLRHNGTLKVRYYISILRKECKNVRNISIKVFVHIVFLYSRFLHTE